MISYKNSRRILKKSKIKIDNEILDVDNCINRVSADNYFRKDKDTKRSRFLFYKFIKRERTL